MNSCSCYWLHVYITDSLTVFHISKGKDLFVIMLMLLIYNQEQNSEHDLDVLLHVCNAFAVFDIQ